MGADRTHILILNYNGRALLEECLPSVVKAAKTAPFPCRVSVVDNDSQDNSLEYLGANWPEIGIYHEPNHGLASFNSVLAKLDEPVVLLLNNDVKLDQNAVAPLVQVVASKADALFSAPLCWDFDGILYEGMRTRVRTRFGLVQGMARVPGHEEARAIPDLTASAGPVLAVDRAKFVSLGGYDRLYFPGRIEDLDLGFRGWMAGYSGYYVPESIAYHRGFGSFGPAFGTTGCDELAARNSLLFAWKNLSGPRLLEHLAWLPLRLMKALTPGRAGFARAFVGACRKIGPVIAARRALAVGQGNWLSRQEAYFERFHW